MNTTPPPPRHVPLHLLGVTAHLLVDRDGAVLIDTGLVGGLTRLQRAFERLRREPSDLRAILLTHGHLDHTAGAHAIQRWFGAPVYAHRDDARHIDGAYPYTGWARVCGALEHLGRRALDYTPVRVGRWVDDGDELPWWGGLRVVHLPGHTAGHCGFYSPSHDTLFAGDLFAVYAGRVRRPPRFLSTEPDPACTRPGNSTRSASTSATTHARWTAKRCVGGSIGCVGIGWIRRRRFAGLHDGETEFAQLSGGAITPADARTMSRAAIANGQALDMVYRAFEEESVWHIWRLSQGG